MKINWATGIIISFILFGGFIGFLVYIIQTHDDFQYDLVVKNYYEEELNYNKNRISKANASTWAKSIRILKEESSLKILNLPPLQKLHIKGYCPYDSQNDFLIEAKTDSIGIVNLSNSYFIEGNWTLTFYWNVEDIAFQIEKKYFH